MLDSRLRGRRAIELAIIGILLAVYAWRFVLPVFTTASPRADDFQDYLYAARQIAVGGNPYGDFLRNHLPWDWSLSSGYLYPPAFAALLIPLTWLPADTAVRLWLLLIQGMVLASIAVVYATIGRPSRQEALALTAVVTSFFPLAASVWTGAMNTVLLFLLTLAWAAWLRRRDVAAGALIGAGAVFKVFPAALLPYLAWRRDWRLCAALVATGIAGLAACFAVTGWDHNLYYFRELLPHLSAGTGYRENQSLAGVAARLCDPSTAEHGGSAGWCGRAIAWPAALGVLALVLAATRRPARNGLEFALAVCALPLISSVTWSFHLVLLILPIALVVRRMFEGGWSRAQRRLLLAAWACFALAPLVHYALIIEPVSASGIAGALVGALNALFDETYLVGTLILFGVLWLAVRSVAKAAVSQPAELAAA